MPHEETGGDREFSISMSRNPFSNDFLVGWLQGAVHPHGKRTWWVGGGDGQRSQGGDQEPWTEDEKEKVTFFWTKCFVNIWT